MKIREFVRTAAALLLVVATISLAGCGYRPYKFPEYNFAGRPIPPSKFDTRVMVSVANSGATGTGGTLAILDAKRDVRFSVYNVNGSFSISGYGTNDPTRIFNYPEQLTGVVYSPDGAGTVSNIDYGGEKPGTPATVGTTAATASDIFVPSDLSYVVAAEESAGYLQVISNVTGYTGNYVFSLPGAYKVAVNPSHTVMLVMTRNNNNVYRVVKLNTNDPQPAGALSCLPSNLPVYCVLPVTGSFDRPYGATFSNDGSQVYIHNCGPECGGTASSISVASTNALRYDNYPGPNDSPNYPTPVTRTVPVPGGATTSISDGTTLYVAGQSKTLLSGANDTQTGLFTGYLSTIDLASLTVTGTYPISDGTHSKMLFADNNTLWIGSQTCATGKRQATGQNYNCLTRFDLGTKTPQLIPAVTPGGATKVAYPNTNQDQYYYGSLTGLCWVQNRNKIYTAYGGQVHAFNTADGSEIDNTNITVQGLALDVAFMDALTNAAN